MIGRQVDEMYDTKMAQCHPLKQCLSFLKRAVRFAVVMRVRRGMFIHHESLPRARLQRWERRSITGKVKSKKRGPTTTRRLKDTATLKTSISRVCQERDYRDGNGRSPKERLVKKLMCAHHHPV